MTPDQIFVAFSGREGFPREAMAAAGAIREDMIPLFLEQIDRLQSDEPEAFNDADVSAFLFVYFLLANGATPAPTDRSRLCCAKIPTSSTF